MLMNDKTKISQVDVILHGSQALTEDQFKRALPRQIKKSVTSELITGINKLIAEPDMRENFRDNLLSYTGVMNDGRYKIGGYIAAVKYVSYKLLGSSNIEAYTKTFPDRFQRLVDEKATNKTISSYATAFNKTQLVTKIMEQTLVPTHILNADIHQKAINVQATLMVSANSEKVRCDAANSLLTHLKQPEVTKVELDVNIRQDKSIDDLRATTVQLASIQRNMIKNGQLTADAAAKSKLVILDSDELEESTVGNQ